MLDLCVYPDAGIIEDLYLDRLRAGKPVASATLTRFRLPLADRSVRREQLAEQSIELAAHQLRALQRAPHRYVWGNSNGVDGWLEEILKIDTTNGATLSWSQPSCHPGEPVFVAHPDAEHEDDGVLLSVVLDARSETRQPRSFLSCSTPPI